MPDTNNGVKLMTKVEVLKIDGEYEGNFALVFYDEYENSFKVEYKVFDESFDDTYRQWSYTSIKKTAKKTLGDYERLYEGEIAGHA